jgi:hypothetical protein
VLANSGMTSTFNSSTTVGDNAAPLAMAVATQVAASSMVGGRNLNPGASPCVAGQEICVNIVTTAVDFVANPQVTVQVQRTDLPTFFARIWGTTQIKVAASATAEAYNPTSLAGTAGGPGLPIAPMCVKPWLVPNKDPSSTGNPIFSATTGQPAATTNNLQGWVNAPRLKTICSAANGGTSNCLPATSNAPAAWEYYPGDPADFTPPTAASVACVGCAGFNNYQLSIAGCVQTPISCNSVVHVDTATDANSDGDRAISVSGGKRQSHRAIGGTRIWIRHHG